MPWDLSSETHAVRIVHCALIKLRHLNWSFQWMLCTAFTRHHRITIPMNCNLISPTKYVNMFWAWHIDSFSAVFYHDWEISNRFLLNHRCSTDSSAQVSLHWRREWHPYPKWAASKLTAMQAERTAALQCSGYKNLPDFAWLLPI